MLLLDSLHGPISSLLSLSAAAGGLWLLAGRLRPGTVALPSSSQGWIERLEGVLASFERLDPEGEGAPTAAPQQLRRRQLAQLQERQGRRHLEIALVGSIGWDETLQTALLESCTFPLPLRLHRSHPLPPAAGTWQWPEPFQHCDHLIHRLDLPLKAADLRWLEALPRGQAVWLLVDRPAGGEWTVQFQALQLQLPEPLRERCWPWSPEHADALATDLAPWPGSSPLVPVNYRSAPSSATFRSSTTAGSWSWRVCVADTGSSSCSRPSGRLPPAWWWPHCPAWIYWCWRPPMD